MRTKLIFCQFTFFTFIFLLLFTNTTYGQFCTQVGGDINDDIFEVHQPNSNHIIVAGHTDSFGNGRRDLYCASFLNNGTPLWSQAIGYDGIETFASSMITSDSQFVIAGTHQDTDPDLNTEIIVFSLRLNGNPVWRQRIPLENFDLTAAKVLETSDNNILVVGTQSDGSISRSFFVLLNGTSGALIASRTINIFNPHRVQDAIIANDNSIVVVATDVNNGGGFFFYRFSAINNTVSKLGLIHPQHNSVGDLIPREIIETDEGNFIIVGGTTNIHDNLSFGFIMVVNPVGTFLSGVLVESATSTTSSKGNMLESIHKIPNSPLFLIAGELESFKYLATIDTSVSLVNSRIYGQLNSKLFDAISISSGNMLAGGVDPGPEGFSLLPLRNGAVMSTLPDLTNCCNVDEVGILVSGSEEQRSNFKLSQITNDIIPIQDGEMVDGGTRAPVCLPVASRALLNEVKKIKTLQAYPNPAKNVVSIKLDEDLSEIEYQIYSMKGRLLLKGTFPKNSTEINTQSLPTGTYILKITGANQVYSHHLVITK
ncbi:T9SS type A sorting domain-containing protein [Kordia sp.]|uniref:T9SS type A sorting domain-containing protein n=1 Tax=Kordia sp. TaxID=1965332 RepID=UPI0025BCA6AD|nr:T9SS type A sorting domain-containing protein [Kordia sp.]MCH2195211.1 T9SS type A sorting domain-containing protein [Kordia sp.]